MTLQHTFGNVYFIWRKQSESCKAFAGVVVAEDPYRAAIAGRAAFGAGIVIKRDKYGRTLCHA